jgi:hypothetical protein
MTLWQPHPTTKAMGSWPSKHWDPQLVGDSLVWKGERGEEIHQTIDSGPPWRIPLDGITHLHRHGANKNNHRTPSMGENHVQYLDEKTKEKALTKEMKRTYGTKRGFHAIIFMRINDIATRMSTKLMACKMLRKCCKEEVPAGVVATAT